MTTPEAWTKVKLSQIADIGWGDLSVTKKSYVESGYTAFSATGADGYLPYFDYDQDGIVVSAIGANCGKIWRAYGKWSCIKNTMRIIIKDAPVSLDYLYYFLSDPKVFPKRGSGQPFISKEDARDIEIAYPAIGEQHKIVELLEEHLSRLDVALVDVKQAKMKAAQFCKSLLQAAFTGNLDDDGARLMTQWQTIKLGELADVSRGSTITRKEVFPGEVPVIAGGQTPSCYHNVSNRQGKTITVSASGAYAGYVQYFEKPIFASDCSTIKVKDENLTSSKFLFYMLLASQAEIYAFQRGSGQPHVYPSQLVGLDIPTPTIDEQHKIVELLEDHLSRLDAAIADVKQAKMKAAQFRRSLLQAAFTGNLDYDGASLFAEWQTKTIGEIADTQLGKMLNKGKQTGENTVPYLRSVNVQWGRVDTSDLNQMDILPSELAKFTIKKGDLLICEGGESGRVAIWDREEPIGFQNALHRVRAKSEVTNKYLYYYFEWLVKNQLIEHLFNGVTIKHFPQENLRSVEVSYPAIDEQRVIVEHLEGHLSRLDASVSLADAMEKQSNGLRRSLLQSAFTGQLTKEVVNV